MSEDQNNATLSSSDEDSFDGESLAPMDFSGLVVSFGTSALINLGQMPDPLSGRSARDLVSAKQTIDMLGLLEEKTRGNLTPEEERILTELLRDLRISYARQVG